MKPLQHVKSLTVKPHLLSQYRSLPLEALIGCILLFVKVAPEETFVLNVLFAKACFNFLYLFIYFFRILFKMPICLEYFNVNIFTQHHQL